MQLSQSVRLKQKQSLVMTPQLQQAIKLLQMSNLELSQHLQEQIYENPFLDVITSEDKHASSSPDPDHAPDQMPDQAAPDRTPDQDMGDKISKGTDHQDGPAQDGSPQDNSLQDRDLELRVADSDNDLSSLKESAVLRDDPTLHGVDDNRFDGLPQTPAVSSRLGGGDSDYDLIGSLSAAEGFYPRLFKQMNLAFTDAKDRLIASHFINALEPSGWICVSIEEIALEVGCTPSHAESVLLSLQMFEPAGLFARDLAECLRLQLIDRGDYTPLFAALLQNLDQLGRGEIKQLSRKLKCTHDDILDMLALIRGLNPKPGEHLGLDYKELPSPDVIVRQTRKGWSVALNRSTLPSVHINEDYAKRLGDHPHPDTPAADASVKAYASDALTQARWLKRAVEQRNQTTLKISAEIIRHQRDFLEKGLDYLKPLSLRDVALAVGMHESTVSRVTTGLLISTPRGGMPLKSFFSVNITSKDSALCASAASVRNMVKRIIASEPPQKPLSDEAISKLISAKGIDLARRTVAKYREMLNIPSSSRRRMQARLSDFR